MTKRIFLDSLPIDSISLNELFSYINKCITSNINHPKIIFYANIHTSMLAKKNILLRKALKHGDMIYADGWGVVCAVKFLNSINLSNRFTAYNFFPDFCQMIQINHYSIYLLGSTEKNIKKTVLNIRHLYPNIRIAGFHHGYFTKKEEKIVIHSINSAKPDFVLVGMGSPKQELWAWKYRKHIHAKVIWCVGGLFDYLSGNIKHCPQWMGDMGFQWLWRLIHEPKRLWKRYLLELPQFFFYIIQAKLFG